MRKMRRMPGAAAPRFSRRAAGMTLFETMIFVGILITILSLGAICFAEVMRLRGSQQRYQQHLDAADYLLRRIAKDVRAAQAFEGSAAEFRSDRSTLILDVRTGHGDLSRRPRGGGTHRAVGRRAADGARGADTLASGLIRSRVRRASLGAVGGDHARLGRDSTDRAFSPDAEPADKFEEPAMRGIGLRGAGRSAFATLQTLVLLTLLLAMIAAAMQHNATQRRYLMLQQDRSRALELAESGVEEALHRLALKPASGAAERRLGRGSFSVDWRPADSTQDVFDVVSTGWARTGDPATPSRIVRVKAALTRSGADAARNVRVLSWRVE